MKKIITVFVFCFLFSDCFSQAGEWVWIKGPNISSVPANFGVQGVPSPTNNPPSVYEACEWTDLNGNFWLFGGYHGGTFNDLWKYDPVLNEWTWMKGPGIMGNFGNYGTLGIPSPANNPPSRGYGAATWTDSLGNLWLFGGSSSIGPASDLWKYDVLTNEWTWMKGPNIGNQPNIFGTQGVADPGNNPGARWECVGTWTDNNSDLWLYSGFTGFGGNNFDDLWKYNIGSNQWTWMKGSQTQFQPAVYGTLGIEDSLNTPGSRAVYSRWKDANGNLWLFGGMIMALEINDLWRYKPITNNWTWMGGSTITGATGIYNTKCIASPASIPGARMENRACWTDHNDNFWFFGGGRGGEFN